jgi:hypothetical protein
MSRKNNGRSVTNSLTERIVTYLALLIQAIQGEMPIKAKGFDVQLYLLCSRSASIHTRIYISRSVSAAVNPANTVLRWYS